MAEAVQRSAGSDKRRIIFAASLGTVFEWYDFYLYGALASIIAKQFFGGLNERSAFIFALLAFAAGFVVRPFGAIFFGRLGDTVGRKHTFLVTIVVMGLSTFMVGILPNYASVGVAAPVMLIALRMFQGLAMGGEYGGAAISVAEHAPAGQRGAYTAWIQTTATLGLLLSLLVIWGTRTALGEAAFSDWGWRIPFLMSILLLGVSVYIRLTLKETPAFTRIKREGRTARAPLSESFARWKNLRIVLLALFGLTAGQAVIWYTGQVYTLFFLTQLLKVEGATANILVAISLVIGTPFFVVFGALSDRIGRKPIIMTGCLLAVLTYMPAFKALTAAANPDLAIAQAANQVIVYADPPSCSLQFNPMGTAMAGSACDIAKEALSNAAVSYENALAAVGESVTIKVGTNIVRSYSPQGLTRDAAGQQAELFKRDLAEALEAAGYPTSADMRKFDAWRVIAILSYLVVLVAMVYGPLAAMLVELFPTRIRYTSMSLPYHIGNGWFGGLMPAIAFTAVAQTGNMYNGLWYPIAIAATTLVVGVLLVKETRGADIYADD